MINIDDIIQHLKDEIEDAENDIKEHNQDGHSKQSYGYGWMRGRLDTLEQLKNLVCEEE